MDIKKINNLKLSNLLKRYYEKSGIKYKYFKIELNNSIIYMTENDKQVLLRDTDFLKYISNSTKVIYSYTNDINERAEKVG